jgi:hypothetical protein
LSNVRISIALRFLCDTGSGLTSSSPSGFINVFRVPTVFQLRLEGDGDVSFFARPGRVLRVQVSAVRGVWGRARGERWGAGKWEEQPLNRPDLARCKWQIGERTRHKPAHVYVVRCLAPLRGRSVATFNEVSE